MSNSTDSEALTAWADALRNGLGRVRFGDLPDDEFERILESVPADDVDTLVVFAENASMAGLESMESAGPLVPRVRRAISARRAELAGGDREILEFPGTCPQAPASPPPKASRLRDLLLRLVSAFAEPATGYDSTEEPASEVDAATLQRDH